MDDADKLAAYVEKISERLSPVEAGLGYIFLLPLVVLVFLAMRVCENIRLLLVRCSRALWPEPQVSGEEGCVEERDKP